jgi:5'-methylthioadenosine phosphorylase
MAERLGIIGGSAFFDEATPAGAERTLVPTDRGDVTVDVADGFVFLRRHGHDRYVPPHRVPHHAHALALERLGVRRAMGLLSVGALRPDLELGTAIVPDDYLSFHPPPTFGDDERLHIVPALDPDLRATLLEVARETDGPVHDGGVYAETRGPRFETRAEIRMLANFADVVGMTGASEATLLQERGVACALLGIVDNLAHGVGPEPLTLAAYEARLEENRTRARAILAGLIRRCGP